MNADRKRVTLRRHLDLVPSAPTDDQMDAYRVRLWGARIRLGLQYQTGPRYGQQLAEARKAVRP